MIVIKNKNNAFLFWMFLEIHPKKISKSLGVKGVKV